MNTKKQINNSTEKITFFNLPSTKLSLIFSLISIIILIVV